VNGSMFGAAVWTIQQRMPQARVIYVSATAASEPRNMAYMERLSIWGNNGLFRNNSQFIKYVGAS